MDLELIPCKLLHVGLSMPNGSHAQPGRTNANRLRVTIFPPVALMYHGLEQSRYT